ncbi:hypothetical protein MOO46_04905 [Apilactobacillus apisilvae]|uniref:DUF4064 domain-containing protein n=1 Tax=Apilactobacillus apisilvae TaxID=2923364 RepID=A0ABY4PGG3_9LACO|nr:hypothetical protein [Apilactobacillus apisilvae]UQS84594.1 hypothetical protein MOO46_04905 [Apilactobacillus apisilvae]
MSRKLTINAGIYNIFALIAQFVVNLMGIEKKIPAMDATMIVLALGIIAIIINIIAMIKCSRHGFSTAGPIFGLIGGILLIVPGLGLFAWIVLIISAILLFISKPKG